MTYTVRHIGTVTVQAESEAALEAMLLSYWTPQSVGKVRAKAVCPICKGHSRFDECSCHYEGITA